MTGGLPFTKKCCPQKNTQKARNPEVFEISAFLQTLAMIHSIEMINNPTLLSGIKLGYKIYDTCTNITEAMAAALRYVSKFNSSREIVEFKCDYSNLMPRVKAVIGAGYSEITMAVSRMLSLQLIATVQMAANNACIAFREALPAFLSDTTIEVRINQTLERIIAEAEVNVIVVFLSQFHVFNLFSKALERNINKTWISWSTSTKIATIPDIKRTGKVVGFTFRRGNMSSFHSCLQNLYVFPMGCHCLLQFMDGGSSFHSDAHGAMNTGYNIVLWREINGHMTITRCPGQMKKTTKSQDICCYECVTCPENHYSNQTDTDHCLLCNNETHWAPVGSTMCFEKEMEYLDSLAILLLALSLLGILFVLAIGIIFTRNLNTPVVKSSGELMVCFVILFCPFLHFAGTDTIWHELFTLCIVYILMKSLKILLAFSCDPKLQNVLKCCSKPIPIIFTCTGILAVNVSLPRVIIFECEEGSILAFGSMLGYTAIPAFMCFIRAFKGRKLPENYNEAKFITFGMLICFIAWITFIPIYHIWILCCMFFPKCYVTLSKQETNTKSVFLKMIYSYSSHSVGSLAMSHNNVTISNPSSAGGSAIQQKSRDLQVRGFAHICRENATSRSKALPQKNMNESLRHDMFQNEMFSRVFAFKKCIYFLNKYTLCFFTTTTCTKFPPVQPPVEQRK
ncbi:hypothetical protein AB1E18_007167 [Capra hircus]